MYWKIAGAVLVLYSLISGFLGEVPALPILHESIRNLYFHVPMWFAMIFLLCVSLYHSIRCLSRNDLNHDTAAAEASKTAMLFGVLGLTTGMIWVRGTWGINDGIWWASDPKLNGSAVTLLTYAAYFVLRGSMDEEQKRARVSAVYNVFAFVMMLVFLFILPRMADSLHPGNGGNPGFSAYDLDSKMRPVFYPAVAGWILFAAWLLDLRIRYKKVLTSNQ
jgi:heme exporter protein C